MKINDFPVLMEEAELCRRAMGHDRRELPSREQMDALLTPLQEVKLKGRCIEAINRGLEAEEEAGEVDEVLAQLEKKTAIG